jgi:hypothetical protein
MEGFCDDYDETSGFITVGNFLICGINCQLVVYCEQEYLNSKYMHHSG